MRGNYQKYEVQMKLENHRFRLWKNGQDEAVCILETYKEKRSVFLSVQNLLPSAFLQSECKGAYHFLLLGVEDGTMIHRDFGEFYVNQSGEGSFFQKFFGPELGCYTHCLLIAAKGGEEDTQIVYRGETPFFMETPPRDIWKECLDWCTRQTSINVFSEDADETLADWVRVPADMELPPALAPAKALIDEYHHYILGRHGDRCYVGIPGRFLQKEQPCREENLFLLWQPLRGGEQFFDRPESMSEQESMEIFGYWIAEVVLSSGTLKSM